MMSLSTLQLLKIFAAGRAMGLKAVEMRMSLDLVEQYRGLVAPDRRYAVGLLNSKDSSEAEPDELVLYSSGDVVKVVPEGEFGPFTLRITFGPSD